MPSSGGVDQSGFGDVGMPFDSGFAAQVRKGGLEPPRYCYRQPLKLGNLLGGGGLSRILRTDGRQERAAARARDDFIRTNSHTAWPLRLRDSRRLMAGRVE